MNVTIFISIPAFFMARALHITQGNDKIKLKINFFIIKGGGEKI